MTMSQGVAVLGNQESDAMRTVPPYNPIDTAAAWTVKPTFVEFRAVGVSERFFFIRLNSITCIEKDYQAGTRIYTSQGIYQVAMSYDEVKSILLNSGE